MKLGQYIRQTDRYLRDNSPVVLTVIGLSGLAATVYLTAKASFKAAKHLSELPPLSGKETAKQVWKFYIPAAVAGAATASCMVGSTKAGAAKTAAAYTLLSVSEKAFDEYKDKVVEQIGAKKEQAIHDSIAQDKVNATPAPLIVSGSNDVLCFELHTGRYFNSDMETLRKAENQVNAKVLRENEATLSDFYYLVGLPNTSYSSGTGWTSDKMLELRFSTVMSEDNRPCIAFEYNYVKPL